MDSWLKCFFGLSYLPPDAISDVFTAWLSISPTIIFTKFTDYILEKYILLDSDFPPVMRASAKNNNNPRSKNSVENFHRHYTITNFTRHIKIST